MTGWSGLSMVTAAGMSFWRRPLWKSSMLRRPARRLSRPRPCVVLTRPDTFLADAGYFSEDNVDAVTEAGIDPLIATGRQKQTKKGRADYARRKAIVEPVFGQLKTVQDAGQPQPIPTPLT